MRECQLEGQALDAAVALALGWWRWDAGDGDFEWRGPPEEDDEMGWLQADSNWSPSTCWDTAGDLIEKRRISILAPTLPGGEWQAAAQGKHPDHGQIAFGPTALVAAMRALVMAS